ncbi:hypothetical protein AALP_AA1G200700 [Arabis alpina]|uniref:GTD-binding domain-containing protein n=1 Tax=Arabis alpina TaxID=50452 RepID=A0A087HPE0_ARAAL|nr:hypothetical protein AALP_AA1G200700 [Arabis alpina]
MEFASFLKLLSQTGGFGCGFFVFGCFSQIFSLVLLCFLLVWGLKFLHFKGHSSFAPYVEKIYRIFPKTESYDSIDREHKGCNNNEFVSKSKLVNGLDHKQPIILHWSSVCEKCDLLLLLPDVLDLNKNRDTSVAALSETVLNEEGEEEEESQSRSDDDDDDEDQVFDVITLRKMVRRERKRGDCMKTELEKERRASESAAEEAMAMLLKLRMEKSSVEMEAKQYKKVAEQKQIYDQQVIQSLQWMLMKLDDEEDKIEN